MKAINLHICANSSPTSRSGKIRGGMTIPIVIFPSNTNNETSHFLGTQGCCYCQASVFIHWFFFILKWLDSLQVFPYRLLPLDCFLPMLFLSRGTTICMSSWRTHKDTTHAKAAKWIRRMIRVYTHPSSQRFISLSHAKTRLRDLSKNSYVHVSPDQFGSVKHSQTVCEIKMLIFFSAKFRPLHTCQDVLTILLTLWCAFHCVIWWLAVCSVLHNGRVNDHLLWNKSLECLSLPHLHLLLVSVEQIKQFKLWVISSIEMTFRQN